MKGEAEQTNSVMGSDTYRPTLGESKLYMIDYTRLNISQTMDQYVLTSYAEICVR